MDGNGFWDQDEVKALFLKELDKIYAAGAPESDIYERREEMERMREHVFNEADLNHDGLIRYVALINRQNTIQYIYIYFSLKLFLKKDITNTYSHYSYQEFLEQTKKPDFQRDEGWQGLDEQQIYSQQEYEAYERRRQEEIQKMVAKGMVSTWSYIASALKDE